MRGGENTAVGIVVLSIVALALGLWLGMLLFGRDDDPAHDPTQPPVTVRESTTVQPINNNKTVPLKETHTESNHYYTQPCKGVLPDTGPAPRRHKAH